MVDDKFIISSIKDSKKISKVLANDTARAILDLLAEKSMTAAQIADKMKLPLTTIDYSLKNLESVSLIKTRNGFNENKRIVKYYEPQEKFIVLAPKQSGNILAALKTLIPIFLIVVIASFMLENFVKQPVYTTIEREVPASTNTNTQRSNDLGVAATHESDIVGDDSNLNSTKIERETVVTYKNPHYGLILLFVSSIFLILYAVWKTLRKNS